MAAFMFALGLLILLFVVALAFYWQGSIRFPGAAISYGVEDSIAYITPRLTDATRTVIGVKSVRRILEWEMKFLQDELDRDPDHVVVIGGGAAAAYVLEQTAKEGFAYEPALVDEVLRLQAGYLASIGAIAAPVAGDEIEALEDREAQHG